MNDWYLDTATGDVYEKTGASAWTLRANIKGPQGIQGVQGAQGVTGATGPQGPPGDEMFVGPNDPGATFDLWYDTDEPMLPAGGAGHAATHSLGSSDPLVNAAWTDQANVFTQLQTAPKLVLLDGTQPQLRIDTTAVARISLNHKMAPVDQRKFLLTSQAGNFYIQSINDAETVSLGIITISQTGDLNTTGGLTLNKPAGRATIADGSGPQIHLQMPSTWECSLLYNAYASGGAWIQNDASKNSLFLNLNGSANGWYFYGVPPGSVAWTEKFRISASTGGFAERGRNAPVGEWTAWTPVVTNEAGTAMSTGTMYAKYTLIGKTLFWLVYCDTISVATTTNYIKMTLPAGLAPSSDFSMWSLCRYYYGGGFETGYCAPVTTGTLNFYRPAGAWAGPTTDHIYQCGGFYPIP